MHSGRSGAGEGGIGGEVGPPGVELRWSFDDDQPAGAGSHDGELAVIPTTAGTSAPLSELAQSFGEAAAFFTKLTAGRLRAAGLHGDAVRLDDGGGGGDDEGGGGGVDTREARRYKTGTQLNALQLLAQPEVLARLPLRLEAEAAEDLGASKAAVRAATRAVARRAFRNSGHRKVFRRIVNALLRRKDKLALALVNSVHANANGMEDYDVRYAGKPGHPFGCDGLEVAHKFKPDEDSDDDDDDDDEDNDDSDGAGGDGDDEDSSSDGDDDDSGSSGGGSAQGDDGCGDREERLMDEVSVAWFGSRGNGSPVESSYLIRGARGDLACLARAAATGRRMCKHLGGLSEFLYQKLRGGNRDNAKGKVSTMYTRWKGLAYSGRIPVEDLECNPGPLKKKNNGPGTETWSCLVKSFYVHGLSFHGSFFFHLFLLRVCQRPGPCASTETTRFSTSSCGRSARTASRCSGGPCARLSSGAHSSSSWRSKP